MIFDAAKIVIIGAIMRKIVKLLTPAHSSIGSNGAKIITAVPKSGWFNTIEADNKVNKHGIIIMELSLTSSWWFDKYFATTMTVAHFKYSDGWI